MLDVNRLSFAYGKRPILSDISFEAAQGEMIAVLGPNGSGKSTLLRCLNRILRPGGGKILLGNQPLETFSMETIARMIAYVPQKIETTSLTVFDAVLLGRKPYFSWFASKDDYRRVETILARFGLDALADRSLDQLSGGETQKVAIARALVQEPKLILLDEPTSALDMKNQVEILSFLRDVVQKENLLVLLSMHDINTALRYAGRFLLLKNGSLAGDVDMQGLSPELIERVYDLPVEIHRSGRDISFIVEALPPQ